MIPFGFFAEIGTHAHGKTIRNQIGQTQDQNNGRRQTGPRCSRYHSEGGNRTVNTPVDQFTHVLGQGGWHSVIGSVQNRFVVMRMRTAMGYALAHVSKIPTRPLQNPYFWA